MPKQIHLIQSVIPVDHLRLCNKFSCFIKYESAHVRLRK